MLLSVSCPVDLHRCRSMLEICVRGSSAKEKDYVFAQISGASVVVVSQITGTWFRTQGIENKSVKPRVSSSVLCVIKNVQ